MRLRFQYLIIFGFMTSAFGAEGGASGGALPAHCMRNVVHLIEVSYARRPTPVTKAMHWHLVKVATFGDRGQLQRLHELGMIDANSLKKITPAEAAKLRPDPALDHETNYRKRLFVFNNGKQALIEVMEDNLAVIRMDGATYQSYWHADSPATQAFFKLGEVTFHLSPQADVLKTVVNIRDLELMARLSDRGLFKAESVRAVASCEKCAKTKHSFTMHTNEGRPTEIFVLADGRNYVLVEGRYYEVALVPKWEEKIATTEGKVPLAPETTLDAHFPEMPRTEADYVWGASKRATQPLTEKELTSGIQINHPSDLHEDAMKEVNDHLGDWGGTPSE